MIKQTRAPYSKKTLNKLCSALLRLCEENGGIVIPDEHSVWYKEAGVTKKTFNNTVRTFDNFLLFTKQCLLEDLGKYMAVLDEESSVNDGLKLLMRFCTVKSSNERRRNQELEHRNEMMLAVYYYGNDTWMEMMESLMLAVRIDYPFLEDDVLYESFGNWVRICRGYFLEWADEGMKEETAVGYRRLMMHYYRQIFGGAREVMFVRQEMAKD